MDFNDAIAAHSKWKARLRNHIAGGEKLDSADPAILGRDDQCDLGKWILADGKKYEKLSAFVDLKSKHAKFHTAVAGVVRSAKSCPPGKALELLDPFTSEFGQASSAVINALSALKTAIGK